MPKVILGERNRREEALWEYINSKIGPGKEYRTDGEFADKVLEYTGDGFSKWRNRKIPNFFEVLCQMFHKTHITDRQLCKIFGVEYKGRTRAE